MNGKGLALALVLATWSLSSLALGTPEASNFDDRVKSIDYNPQDVVRIMAHYGFQTHVEFDEGETVKYIALGDTAAWEIVPKDNIKNHLFIKPIAERATTNLTVVTTRAGKSRSYQFLLTAHWPRAAKPQSDPNMFFYVKFRYPEDRRVEQIAKESAGTAKRALHGDISERPKNWNYSVCGTEAVAPSEGYDDGTFTYFRFAAASEIPAIFHVNDDASEQLVNMDVNEDDWHVVDRVSKRFVFRKGPAVACVTNESYDAKGYRSATRTTSPYVERVLKGGQP